jgi:short-subunit dehydrogenase
LPRTALVTGATGGIGTAFAEVFAAEGFDLVLTARNEERLRALAEHIERGYGCRPHVIAADLGAPGASARLCGEIAARGLAIDVLVNNAGYGVPGVYTSEAWERHLDALQVLVVAPAELTHRLLPGMIERGYGRILNVASLAGLMPAPAGVTLYPGSKAFLIKFSEALAAEVRSKGVYVTALAPGFTRTGFFDVAEVRDRVSRLPRFVWMDPPAVARMGYDAVRAGQTLAIAGRVNRAAAYLARVMPRRLLRLLARLAGER